MGKWMFCDWQNFIIVHNGRCSLVCRNVRSYICDCFAKLSLFGRGEGRKANPSGGGGNNKTPNRLKYWFVSYEQSSRKGFSETMSTAIITH